MHPSRPPRVALRLARIAFDSLEDVANEIGGTAGAERAAPGVFPPVVVSFVVFVRSVPPSVKEATRTRDLSGLYTLG